MAAMRAEQVDDDEYLDVLGRLIAGALDSAQVDEISFITSEITKLEPVRLRALFGLFHFGSEGVENADPDLSPANAAWAVDRYRPEREIAYLLHMGREATSQVLLRLERDCLIQWGDHSRDDERTRGPSDWAGRVLSLLFPSLNVTFGDRSGEESDEVSAPTAAPPSTTISAVLASITAEDSYVRQQRTISELETEIKKSEKERLSPLAHDITGVNERWLSTLKQRLRRVDPDNPWAYDD